MRSHDCIHWVWNRINWKKKYPYFFELLCHTIHLLHRCWVECPWIHIQLYCKVCHNVISQVQGQCHLSTVTCHTWLAYLGWKIFSITYCGFLPSVLLVTSFTRSVLVFVVLRAAWPALAMVVDITNENFQLLGGNILDLYQDRTDVEWVWWKHLLFNYCEFVQSKELISIKVI